MQHFFVTPEQVQDNYIYIEGSDVNHMKNVLRMHIGEEARISDGNNVSYRCRIDHYADGQAVLEILETYPVDTELASNIYLFQGLPKQDQVIPVATKRAVVKLDEKKAAKKILRWQQIAESAAKQAGRGYIPEIRPVMNYREALKYAESLDVVLIPYELAEGMSETKEILRKIQPGQSVGVFIGPEGGFEVDEVEMAIEAGAKAITLGKRILRTETAGLTTLSILMFHLED